MNKLSMSTISEPESLSFSRYHAPSSPRPFEVDFTGPPKQEVKKTTTDTPLPNPFAHEALQHELFGLLARTNDVSPPPSTLWTLVGVAVGVGLGVLLAKVHASTALIEWIQFPGELFLDAVLCVVVPAAFCKVVVAVAEIVSNGTVRRIALSTAVWFCLSTLLAAAVGTFFALAFAATFRPSGIVPKTGKVPQLAFECASQTYLTMDTTTGAVVCGAPNATTFTVQETDSLFVRSSAAFATVSLTDQVVGILSNMIPVNFLAGFVDGTFVSVVFIAFFFAVACVHGHDSREGVPNYILLLITQTKILLSLLMCSLLKLLPFAVMFFVAGAVAKNDASLGDIHDVGYLVLALVVAASVFLYIVMGAILLVMTKCNPVVFFHHLLPAQAFALGSSSTIATMPVTLRCLNATGNVPRALGNIVATLGATCNLTGMSLSIPLAVVFLAKTNNLEHELTAAKYAQLWFFSTIAGYGAKTVDSAEMVMILTIWRAVMGSAPTDLLAPVVAADWLLQRIRTVVNVTGHAIVARIVAEHDNRLWKRPKAVNDDGIDGDLIMNYPHAPSHT